MSGQPERNLPEQPPHLQPLLPVPPQQDQQHPQTEVPASPGSPPTSPATPLNAPSSPTSHPIDEQARIAVVLYDMLLRGGRDADALSAQLSTQYPVAASIACQYADFARQALHVRTPAHQRGVDSSSGTNIPPQRQRRADFVLRRISVANVAWFCFFIASLQASLRLCLIFSLAIATTLANASGNPDIAELASRLVEHSLGEGPHLHMFKWIVRMLTEKNPVVEFGATYGWESSQLLKSNLPAVLLLSPLTMGIVAFILGALAAKVVNLALRAAGGIRFENRAEHED